MPQPLDRPAATLIACKRWSSRALATLALPPRTESIVTSPSPRPSVPSPGHRQRGAAAVFAAISLIAMLTMMALAIDVGRLYFAQRDLQRLANLSALDAARVASGCSAEGVIGSLAAVSAEVQSSLQRNRDSGSSTGISPATRVGRKTVDAAGVIRGFEALGETDSKRNAVEVTLTRQTPSRIFPLIAGGASKTLTAVAVASQQAVGGFTVGSSTLTLSTRESALLNPVLRSLLCPTGGASCEAGINLSAADYQGLAGANVSLGNLIGGATALGLGVDSVADLLALQLTLPQWLGVLGAGLETATTATGAEVSGGVVGLVQGLAGTTENNGGAFGLSELLNGTGVALSDPVDTVLSTVPFIDARSLIIGLAQTASTGNPLEVRGTGLDIPGVAAVRVYLVVGDPARPGLGSAGSEEAVATTQQLTVQVRIAGGALLVGLKAAIEGLVNGLLGLLGAVGVNTTATVLSTDLNIGVDVGVTSAVARLDELQCPTATINNGLPVARLSASAGLATVRVAGFSSAEPAPAALNANTNLPLASVVIDASCLVPGVRVGSVCVGGLNLGTTTQRLTLQMTSADVAGFANTGLNDVSRYTASATMPPYYTAENPVANMNPQTVGSPVNAAITLGLSSTTTSGSGLIGLVSGLVTSLINSLNSGLLAPLLSLVNTLGANLIDPLLNLLGVQLGTSTVTMIGVGVDQPELVSTDR